MGIWPSKYAMDPKKFREFVGQHYEISYPKPKTVGSLSVRRRLEQHLQILRNRDDWEDNTDVQDLAREIEQSLEPKPNMTMPFEIKRRDTLVQCGDCGKTVAQNRAVQSRIYLIPQRHWRHSCNICKQTRNPQTGVFDINNKGAEIFFAEFYKNTAK